MSRFFGKNIDYEDREWILDLLLYLYIVALRITVTHKQMTKLIQKDETKTTSKMKVYKIEPKNVRKQMLKRHNRPTLSLDDYADMVIESMEKFEAANKNIVITKKIDELTEEERKDEEKKDNSHYNTGNRRNFG